MMKTIILMSILLTVGIFQAEMVQAQNAAKKPVLDIYYTHSTNRCAGCNAIEKETVATLNKDFKSQLESGEITLHIINIDLKENKSLVNEFEIWGSSLFIVKNGDKKNTIDLTKEGFATARTKPETFQTTLANAVNKALK